MSVPTLLITGTVGVGKSTVAAEINDVLDLKVPNAAIDLDALVWQWPSTSEWNSDLMFVQNDNRQVREVALEVLVRAGWVSSNGDVTTQLPRSEDPIPQRSG